MIKLIILVALLATCKDHGAVDAKEVEHLYGFDCEDVDREAHKRIIRCVNREVVCYYFDGDRDGGLSCFERGSDD